MWRVTILIFVVALSVSLLRWSQSHIPTREARPHVELSGRINFDAMFEQITAESVGQAHRHIVDAPTRLAGTPGDLKASQYIEQEFRRLGLDVVVQRFPITIPVTKWCRLTTADGADVPGVSLLPFWPNHVRTCTTGPEGIVGRVIDVGTGSLEDLDGKDIQGNIALVTMTPGYDWLAAAKLGAGAILFRPPSNAMCYAKKILHFPGDIPRFLVQGPVTGLIGRQIRIQARVDWEIHTTRNVYGVLRPSIPSREALLLMGFTDSWSVVPDRAPGYYEACSVTALLEMARALSAQREGLARTTVFAACSGRSMAAMGPRRLLDALGLRGASDVNYKLLQKRLAEARAAYTATDKAVEAVSNNEYWQLDESGEADLWTRYGQTAREALSSVIERMIDNYVAVAEERSESAKLA